MISFHGTFTEADLAATLRGLGTEASFLQVGAMDGVAYDPVHEIIRQNHWHGVLVEPMPDHFEQLKKNYAGCEGLTFVNKAVADFDGEIPMSRIATEDIVPNDLPDWTRGIATLMPDRGLLGGTVKNMTCDYETRLKPLIKTLDVPCLKLETLLQETGIAKLDAMIIDTEGADWMVVRQLPLERLRPRLIYLEYLHLSPYEKIACPKHFINNGYRVFIEKDNLSNMLAVAG